MMRIVLGNRLVVVIALIVGSFCVANSIRVGNTLLEFDFSRSECNSDTFTGISTSNNLVGNLVKKLGRQECLNTNGVSGNASFSVSSKNISEGLQAAMWNNSYTLEFWVQPQLLNTDYAFLSLGDEFGGLKWTKVPPNFWILCRNGFYVGQKMDNYTETEAHVTFAFGVCSQFSNSRYRMRSAVATIPMHNGVPALTHVAINVHNYDKIERNIGIMYHWVDLNFHVNGVRSFQRYGQQSPNDFNTQLWDPDFKLLILDPFAPGYWDRAYVYAPTKWSGTLHYLAMYDKELTLDEVLQNYRAGLPSSPFVVRDSVQTVKQNGEAGDHAKHPEYYSHPIANNDLAVLSLPSTDLDDEPVSPNYDPLVGRRGSLFLSSLPKRGQLYYLNGTEIQRPSTEVVAIPVPYDIASASYAVRYRPTYNRVSSPDGSVYTSFSFYGRDGVTGQRSDDTATVNVIVTPVNQPPVPAPSAASVMAWRMTVLELKASDVDSTIVGCSVRGIPVHGPLYQVNRNGTVNTRREINGYIALTPLLDGSYKVAYNYTGPHKLLDAAYASPVVAYDQFQFACTDAQGRESVHATYELTVVSALEAIPLVNAKAPENRAVTVKIAVNDGADFPRKMVVQIVRLPEYGVLFHIQGARASQAIAVGDFLDTTFDNSQQQQPEVGYRGRPLYFNYPNRSLNGSAINKGPDSFEFVVCAVDDKASAAGAATGATSQCATASGKATQLIAVQNVNNPTRVTFDTPPGSNMLTVYGFSAKQPDSEYTATTVFSGFHVEDPDQGVDYMRVSISTLNGGVLSLNTKQLGQAMFNSQRYCKLQSGFTCAGDGSSDRAMTFVTTAQGLEKVLNGMEYYNFNANTRDVITITVYDGMGGGCLDGASQQASNTIREDCFTETLAITMNVLDFASTGPRVSSSSTALTSTMNYVGIGLLVVLVLAALRAFCVRYKSERDRAAADEEKRNSMLIQQQQSLLEEKISSANTNTDPEQLSATTPQLNKLDSNNAQETRESKLQRLRELVAAEQAESDRLERELAEVEADLEQDRKRAAQRNKGLRGLLSEKKARRYSQQQKLPQQTQHKKQQKDHRSGDVPTAHRGLAMNPQYSHDESSDSFSESSESGEGSDGSSTCSTSCSSTCSVSDVDMEFGSGTDDE